MMDETGLAGLARDALGCDIAFAVARDPVPLDALSAGEWARFETLGHPQRREEWLRGRAALKSVLRRMEISDDTALLSFPHARISLTHSAGLAVAAYLVGTAGKVAGDSPESSILGLGLDFEARRSVRPGTERFFLADRERERLAFEQADGEGDLLRLWTVKEALFKSDPLNGGADGPTRHLWSYVVDGSLRSQGGSAQCPDRAGMTFDFFSTEPEEGFLTVAMSSRSGAYR